MKKLARLLAIALAAILACTVFAACGEKPEGGGGNSGGGGDDTTPKTYTYNTSTSIFPTNWNVHTWENDTDNEVMQYVEMGLYDVLRTKTGGGFEWILEMAAAEPTDVTSKYKNDPIFGSFIKTDTTQAWSITLNQNAKWQNGDAINADTYVRSMELLLDPFYKNYRANSYYSSDFELVNARKYFSSSTKVFELYADAKGVPVPGYADAEDKTLYMSMTNPIEYRNKMSFVDVVNALKDPNFFVKDDVDLMAKYRALQNEYGFFAVTDENREEVAWLIDRFLLPFKAPDDVVITDAERNLLYFFCSGVADSYEFSNVGIKKTGDYSFDLIFVKPVSMFNLKVMLTSNWIVHEKTYLDNSSAIGDLKTTSYGTKIDKYMAYGPYKFESYQTSKEILLTKNENWYGYTDGKHEGQYQTNRIKISFIDDHNTALQKFLTGDLDVVGLTSTDMNTYRDSDNLLKTDETYTWRFTFNTDESKLLEAEKQGGGTSNVNTRIVLNKNFRKAFSLAIDRRTYANECTAGEKAAFSLLSSLYYYDIENNPDSIYRETDQAMEAILKLYGIEYGPDKDFKTLKEAYDSITGYDLKEAGRLFKQAWDESVADGKIDANKAIQLEFLIPAQTLSDSLKTMRDFINKSLMAMAKEAGLEGKISITWKADPNAYDVLSKSGSGIYSVGFCAWGGAAFYPYKTLGVYTDDIANDINEVGFEPQKETLEITADFDENPETPDTTQTDTFYNWVNRLSTLNKDQGGFVDAGHPLKLTILAGVEYGLLDLAIVCPLTTSTSVQMFSKRLQYFTEEYNVFAGYGGIRQLTYKMDDAAWVTYVKENGLSYV